MLKSLLNEIDASEKNVKQFAYLFALIGLIIIPGITFYKHSDIGVASYTSIGFGVVFLLLGLISFKVLTPLYKAWMLLALVLGLVMTKVIVTIVYYLVMTPIGLVKRGHFNKTMHLKFNSKEDTYWIKKTPNEDPKRLERLF